MPHNRPKPNPSPRRLSFGLAVAGLLLFLAPLLPAAEPVPIEAGPLQKGDALIIQIQGIGPIPLPAYREIVDSDGQIALPYLDQLLDAAGKTIPQIQTEMSAAYAAARISTHAQITITRVNHFPEPPARENLRRSSSPLRPVPVPAPPPQARQISPF